MHLSQPCVMWWASKYSSNLRRASCVPRFHFGAMRYSAGAVVKSLNKTFSGGSFAMILAVISIAAGISVLLHFLAKQLSGGFAMIIAAVLAAVFGAILFPVPDEDEAKEAE